MYEEAAIGRTWVSEDNVRWQNWMGRQIYRYRYAGPKKGRRQFRMDPAHSRAKILPEEARR